MISLIHFEKTREIIYKIYSWRLNSKTQENSLSIEKRSFDSFYDHFNQKYHPLKNLPPLLIVQNEIEVGILYFSYWPYPNSCELSLFLDPKFQNHKIGSRALKQSLRLLEESGVEKIVSFVKPENLAASGLFEKLGFQSYGQVELEKYGKTHSVLKFEFRTNNYISPKTTIIAEAGSNVRLGNLQKDYQMAKVLIKKAALSRAQVIKFQLYTFKGVYVENAGSVDYIDQEISDVFNEHALDIRLIPKIASYCKTIGIEFMCSAFSKEDFEVIDPFVNRHKIASYEIRHLRLIELAAKSKKPLILSCGASSMEDIKWAINTFYEKGGEDLTLLHCIAQYPADPKACNLNCIKTLKEKFKVKIGLSDHSLHPALAPTLSVALGATTIEKHFTLNKDLPGPDHFFAIDCKELCDMVEQIILTEKMLGVARRGLQAISPILKGEVFVEGQNVAILRCGEQNLGLHPKYIDQIAQKRALSDIKVGCGINYEDIEW